MVSGADTSSNVRIVLANYDPLNREIPTINVVGFLVKSGLRVIVYRLIISKLEHLIKQVLISFVVNPYLMYLTVGTKTL